MLEERPDQPVRPQLNDIENDEARKDEDMGCEGEGESSEGLEGKDERHVGPEGPESDEIRTPKKARTPKRPTPEEIEWHEITNHAQYRSWCKHCVVGRARDDPHHDKPKTEERGVPIISLD